VSVDRDDDASRLGVFFWSADPKFIATDSMEAYFSTLGPHTGILQEREWWVGKARIFVLPLA